MDVEHSPALKRISEGYLLHPKDPREWCKLRAVSHIPTVVFLLALIIAAAMLLHREWELEGIGTLRELLNTFIELLEVCSYAFFHSSINGRIRSMACCSIDTLELVAAMHNARPMVHFRIAH